MTNGALSRFNPTQPGAQGMKVVATGLLVVMAAVFAVAIARMPRTPLLPGRMPARLERGAMLMAPSIAGSEA